MIKWKIYLKLFEYIIIVLSSCTKKGWFSIQHIEL